MRFKDLPPRLFTYRRRIRRKVNDILYYRTRLETFSFTLSKTIARRLRRVAHQHGMRLSPFIRQSAVAYLETRYLVPANIEVSLSRIETAIRKIQTDLAVIASKATSTGRLSTVDFQNAAQLVQYLWDGLRTFITHPPRSDGG